MFRKLIVIGAFSLVPALALAQNLSLSLDGGIEFPDGSVQSSAAIATGAVDSFVYTVKWICVNEVGPATVVLVEGPLEPALYRTAVNIHNPQGSTVAFDVRAVTARGMGLPRGDTSAVVAESLDPGRALAINCVNISEMLNGPGQLGDEEIGEGMLTIETTVELDVIAVYTMLFVDEGEFSRGAGSSVDVEHVSPKFVRQGVVSSH